MKITIIISSAYPRGLRRQMHLYIDDAFADSSVNKPFDYSYMDGTWESTCEIENNEITHLMNF